MTGCRRHMISHPSETAQNHECMDDFANHYRITDPIALAMRAMVTNLTLFRLLGICCGLPSRAFARDVPGRPRRAGREPAATALLACMFSA